MNPFSSAGCSEYCKRSPTDWGANGAYCRTTISSTGFRPSAREPKRTGEYIAVGRFVSPPDDVDAIVSTLTDGLRADELAAEYATVLTSSFLVEPDADLVERRAEVLVDTVAVRSTSGAPRIGLALFPTEAWSSEGLIQAGRSAKGCAARAPNGAQRSM